MQLTPRHDILLRQVNPKSLESLHTFCRELIVKDLPFFAPMIQSPGELDAALRTFGWQFLVFFGVPFLSWAIAFATDSEAHLVKTGALLGLLSGVVAEGLWPGWTFEVFQELPGPRWFTAGLSGFCYGAVVGLVPAVLIRVLKWGSQVDRDRHIT